MTWAGNTLPWERAAILREVPNASGVYALWRHDTWIYVGETYDLQRRLLEHFHGSEPCIVREGPTSFGFELLTPVTRLERQRALIFELTPVCNRLAP
jgi:predicted GIY-YIG superfamily endonuclease